MTSVHVDYHGLGTRELYIFEGHQLMVTRNIDKKGGLVNGGFGIVLHATPQVVVLRLRSGAIRSVHRIAYETDNGLFYTAFPLLSAYAITIAKVQGQTLPAIAILPETGCRSLAYVAISRVRRLVDLHWLAMPAVKFFVPPSRRR